MTRAVFQRIDQSIANLFPGYFAMVMATGIVSLACHFLGMDTIAEWLFYLNIPSYLLLWILTIARFIRHRERFLADLIDHARGPGFFTIIAGTCILGTQFAVQTAWTGIVLLLWTAGILLWCFLIYAFFAAVTVKSNKPSFETGLNGSWLIAIVATQSLASLSTFTSSMLPQTEVILFFAAILYMTGCLMYIPIISLIFYRWTFFPMTPLQLTPPYWINMGALAITTLAGSRLILNAAHFPLLQDILPFLKGFTLFFWAFGTWWIPLLLILGVWRHFIQRIPLVYDPQFWGMVFPLGMYTTCTFQLSKAVEIPFLLVIPQYFIYLALIAWIVVFIGLIRSIIPVFMGAEARS